jgi:hypothetical protein
VPRTLQDPFREDFKDHGFALIQLDLATSFQTFQSYMALFCAYLGSTQNQQCRMMAAFHYSGDSSLWDDKLRGF